MPLVDKKHYSLSAPLADLSIAVVPVSGTKHNKKFGFFTASAARFRFTLSTEIMQVT